MKGFQLNICTKQEARLIMGVGLFAILDYFIFLNIAIFTTPVIFISCFVLPFQLWMVMKFAEQAPQTTFSIDTRSELQKEEEEYDRRKGLIVGKQNELIIQCAEGYISLNEYKERSMLLDELLSSDQMLLT